MSILPKKTYFFPFYITTFKKKLTSNFILKICFNKILILLHFFIIFFTSLLLSRSLSLPVFPSHFLSLSLESSHLLPLSQRPNTTQNHQATNHHQRINPHPSSSNHHQPILHQATNFHQPTNHLKKLVHQPTRKF